MTRAGFRALVERVGVSLGALADLFATDRRSLARWKAQDQAPAQIEEAMQAILRARERPPDRQSDPSLGPVASGSRETSSR